MTIVREVVGGILLVLGIQTRWVSLALLPILLGALFVVHGGEWPGLHQHQGGWEYPAYLFMLCLGQALLGDDYRERVAAFLRARNSQLSRLMA